MSQSNKIKISEKVQGIPPSGIRQFFDLVLGMPEVISLGVGEPDFVTPWVIRESAIHSVEEGYTSYTSNKGLYKLRVSISQHLKQNYNLNYHPDDEILITVGVSEALDLAVRAIVNPGDKIVVPLPSYVSYGPVSILADADVTYLRACEKNNFKINAKELEKVIDSKTRAIILNYPSNPTGVSYRRQELEAINKVCLKHNLVVISDEIYDDLTYDYKHIPFPTLKDAKPNTIYLNGFSKGYAMTGWRIGYACGPKEVIAGMTKIHQYTMLCAPTMGQFAAAEALVSANEDKLMMKREYKRRREFIVSSLNNLGLTCVPPDGAFYCFASIKKSKLSSMEFATLLLQQEKVAVVPGTAFGDIGEGYIRISYATKMEKLVEAVKRINNFLLKNKRK